MQCPRIKRKEVSVLYIIEITRNKQRCYKKKPFTVSGEFTKLHMQFANDMLITEPRLSQLSQLLKRLINLMLNFYGENLQNFDVCHLELWQHEQLINMITSLRNYLTYSVEQKENFQRIFFQFNKIITKKPGRVFDKIITDLKSILTVLACYLTIS